MRSRSAFFALTSGFWQVRDAPELSFARGAQTCGGSDSCGHWSGFSLEATSGSDTRSRPPGTAARVGAFDVEFHDGTVDEGTSSCADWSMAYRRWLAYVPAGATRSLV